MVKAKSLETLETLRTADGRALPQELIARIGRERRRLELVEEQIQQLEKERETQIVHGTGKSAERMRILMSLCGIGWTGSFRLVVEFFGWRTFQNRRQVAQAGGLAASPYASGTMDREQGISKAGNRRVRALMIELAWFWLRWQPDSELAKWRRATIPEIIDRARHESASSRSHAACSLTSGDSSAPGSCLAARSSSRSGSHPSRVSRL